MSENERDDGYALARAAYNELTSRSYGDPQGATQALTKLAEFFPVCAPGGTTQVAKIPPGHEVLITAYVPEMCDDKGNGGDVFIERSSQSICFRAEFLKKLAAGIGLEWIPEAKKVSFPFAGHPQSGWCCTVSVAAKYRDWSGEMRVVDASKTLDLRDEALVGVDIKEKQLRRERSDIAARAETMAKSRCIADAAIKRTIRRDQVGAPIVCAKVYRTEPTDKDSGNRAASALYGGDGIESARPADVDEVTGEVQHGNPGRGPSSAPHAPAAAPTGNGGASSGVTAPSPSTASRAAPAAEAKPHLIPKGYKGEGKTFAAATDDELAEYAMSLGARIASGEIPAPGAPAAKAKLAAAESEIARRESLNNEAAW